MIAGLTTAAKADLAGVRVLAGSWKRLHPDSRFFVILIDDHENYLDPRDEAFEIISYRELGIPRVDWLAFTLPKNEFAAATIAWSLPLIAGKGYPHVWHFPRGDAMKLMVAMTVPIQNVVRYAHGDQDVIYVHTLVRGKQFDNWQAHVVHNLRAGVAVSWASAMAMLEVEATEPLPMARPSEHDLLRAGLRTALKWPYSHASWPSGEPIHDLYRGAVRYRNEWLEDSFNPLTDAGRERIVAFWNEREKGVPRLAFELYQRRHDLHAALGDPRDHRALDLMAWATEHGVSEHLLPEWWKGAWFQARQALLQPAWPLTELSQVIAERPDLQGLDDDGQLRWLLTSGVTEYAFSPQTITAADRRWRDRLAGLDLIQRLSERVMFWLALVSARNQPLHPKPLSALFPEQLPAPEEAEAIVAPAPREIRVSEQKRPFGVNLVGYAYAEMGVGESVRLMAKAMESADIAYALCPVPTGSVHRQQDRRLGEAAKEFPYAFNLHHVNADQMLIVRDVVPPELSREAYTIGYWAWELEAVPALHLQATAAADEIWTPSHFVADAYRPVVRRPVTVIPHALLTPAPTSFTLEHFGLPEDRFIFLTAFDATSIVERKNPRDVLVVYRRIAADYPQTHLVIKANYARYAMEEMEELRALSEGMPVTFLEETMSRDEMYGLVQLCDCFVSLHRSEGFGLVMAEAMMVGRPVVASAYSGNVDFMNEANSYLVACGRRRVGLGSAPYDPLAIWGAPSLHEAEWQLRRVLDDEQERQRKTAEARRTIKEQFSTEAVGRRIRQRLEQIARSWRSHE